MSSEKEFFREKNSKLRIEFNVDLASLVGRPIGPDEEIVTAGAGGVFV